MSNIEGILEESYIKSYLDSCSTADQAYICARSVEYDIPVKEVVCILIKQEENHG